MRCEVEDEAHHSFTRDSLILVLTRRGDAKCGGWNLGCLDPSLKLGRLGGTSAEGLALLAGLLGTDKGGGRDIIVAWQDMGQGLGMASRMAKGEGQPPVSSPRLPHRALPQIKGGEAGHIPAQRAQPLHRRGTSGKRKARSLVL